MRVFTVACTALAMAVAASPAGADRLVTAVGDGFPGRIWNTSESVGYAQLSAPLGVAIGKGDRVFVADTGNDVVRRIFPVGSVIQNYCGAGSRASRGGILLGDRHPLSTPLSKPSALAIGPNDELLIAEGGSGSIRRVGANDQDQELIASGDPQFKGSSRVAYSPHLRKPAAIAVSKLGTVYVADAGSHSVLRVDPESSRVRVVAGTGVEGFNGHTHWDATTARLSRPSGIAVADDDTVYVSDTGNGLIRAIASDGLGSISTVAGRRKNGDSDPYFTGSATDATLIHPHGIALDARGGLYVADTANHLLRKVDLATFTVETVIGTGLAGFSNQVYTDAREAQLYFPKGVAVFGNTVVIADTHNHAVRTLQIEPLKQRARL